MNTLPEWREIPADRHAEPPLVDDTRDGDGLGWALVWCIATVLALVMWVMLP